jgi:hypothetical protein
VGSRPTTTETNNDLLASLRNVPVLMWNASADELVNTSDGPITVTLAGCDRTVQAG